MPAYYNEIEPYAAQWLRNLIAAGHIAAGEVDERSIVEVRPDDVRGFTQAHFFAGIGVWSHALRLAGWADERPVWTGSCPCQPFSAAGRGDGFDDERHLWPVWQRLIAECRPPVLFGEQVASAATDPWIDLVQSDLEALGYAVAAVPLPAAGIGAPHIRDRLWWVADAGSRGQRVQSAELAQARGGSSGHADLRCGDGVLADADAQRQRGGEAAGREARADAGVGRRDATRLLADAGGAGPQGRAEPGQRIHAQRQAAERGGRAGGVADAADGGREPRPGQPGIQAAERRGDALPEPGAEGVNGRPGPLHGFWASADWLLCRDGKWRPVEPGTQPLAHGAASRVGRLRAYGNAIVAPLAAEFIAAVMECRP